MRRALLTLAAVVALAGCGDDKGAAPEPEPTAVPTTAAAAPQGPTPGAAVPAGAFLKAGDLGQGWRRVAPLALPCPPAFRPKAQSSVGLAEARGTLTETIATEVDVEAVVRAWRQSLEGCGYEVKDDPLGDAGVSGSSSDGDDRVVVTGTEGVLVVVHAHGDLAESAEEMEGWADFAFGTACVAHPDGCHVPFESSSPSPG